MGGIVGLVTGQTTHAPRSSVLQASAEQRAEVSIMDDLSRRLAELAPQRRELLERALQQRGDAFNTFPVSFAQQRLWFLDQWAPGHPVYHLPGALHLSGPLDVAALQHSLQVIVGRHEA